MTLCRGFVGTGVLLFDDCRSLSLPLALSFPLFLSLLLSLVVEDDEDDFPNTRSDGEFIHNNNGSKEKREYSRITSMERLHGLPGSTFLRLFVLLKTIVENEKQFLVHVCMYVVSMK